MRWHEISSGVRIPTSDEETEILNQCAKKDLAVDSLDERGQEVARLMVSRGLLKRFKVNGTLMVRADTANDIWRDW